MLPVSVSRRIAAMCPHGSSGERVLVITDDAGGHDWVLAVAAAAPQDGRRVTASTEKVGARG